MISLSQKTIVVTGAGSGIGKAIALKSLELGALVIVCDINSDGLKDFENLSNAHTYQVNVENLEEVRGLFKHIEENSLKPNALVNNAGIYLAKSILEYTEEQIDRVMNVNIKGAVYCSQVFAEKKISEQDQGVILNISSVAGQEASSDAIYGMTKAALIGLTKSTATNFSPYIRVNAIAPGVVQTPMMHIIPEDRLTSYREHELVKEPITADSVANTATFLLSDQALNYTGAVFDINNGCYLR
ncbi:SDR family oxidoreductase [Candidatus Dojkabacteria bacterium]|uniref:SDR family oxidoreductase n=1 Tax=Candidatus Dojkabacteria bacterium TaxID=2099670 RepID=A0A955L8J0_9BACT|nr:SDR family oxidoreductase [Candidatus Dojkabacteria bacterium]